MNSSLIPEQEVEFLQKRQRDTIGRVFTWEGRIFRGIYPEAEEHVRALFSSGFLEELVTRGYMPRTWITPYRMRGFPLVLEHERIWPVVYPQEWTFSMLKDAAILVCKVGMLAKSYGLNMRDCHGLNILFDGVRPKFTDLGSFIADRYLGWKPYEEFLRFYYYPLQIWRSSSFVGKLSIFSGNLTPHEDYWLYRYPCLRQINPHLLSKLMRLRLKPEIIASRSQSDLEARPGFLRKLLYQLLKRGIFPSRSCNLSRVMKDVERLAQKRRKSSWESYHEQVGEKAKRFARIIEVVNGLGGQVRTAIDLGGNQGRFSRLLANQTAVRKVICVDSDENAIETGYCREKENGTGKITFAHYDFMGCIAKLRFPLPTERFRSDLALALALTHHLILAQGFELNEVLRNISAYAKKYVLIEFMPLGLWTTGQKPQVPEWYNLAWFRKSFLSHFDLILEEKLRENNVLFLGKIRTSR